MARWACLIKRTENGWRGTVPDLPEVVVEGSPWVSVDQAMAKAIEEHLDSVPRSKRVRPRDRTEISYVDVRMLKADREERRTWPKPTASDIEACRKAVRVLRDSHLPLPAVFFNELFCFERRFDDLYGPDPNKPTRPPFEVTREPYGWDFGMAVETRDAIGPEGRGERLVMKMSDADGEETSTVVDVEPDPEPEDDDTDAP